MLASELSIEEKKKAMGIRTIDQILDYVEMLSLVETRVRR
jgi:Asp-tRNA(Asn)/Glu-tRNA(Gln) amidotransferase C subunit